MDRYPNVFLSALTVSLAILSIVGLSVQRRELTVARAAQAAAEAKVSAQQRDLAMLGEILSRSNSEIQQLTDKNSRLAAIGAREEASRKAGWQSAMDQTVALNSCEMAAVRLRSAQEQGEKLSPGAVAALALLKALMH